jgi:endonuclease/exonuclease/phosphatase (EEP) superfamily protein YafD
VPFHVVVGDFNSLSRSVGFDDLRELGFVLASSRARGWRGTYPSALPLYDIDHVWAAREAGLTPTTCRMFSSPSTNHRGQTVILTSN